MINTFDVEFTGQFSKMKSPFEWELVSRNLVTMAAMGLGFFIITLLCEFNFFIKPRRLALNPYMAPSDEDQDVVNERKRTLRGSGRRDLLRLENLTKVSKSKANVTIIYHFCLGVGVILAFFSNSDFPEWRVT